MSFVSAQFLVFLAAVFVLYHATTSIRLQNIIILIASYVFYGVWDWRFIFLLLAISLANSAAPTLLEPGASPARKRIYLWSAISISLLALAVFKYFNFFVASAVSVAALFGLKLHPSIANILLPLGISFMTFQGIAYVVDVWRGEHKAEYDIIRFLAFKAFFPQLVAGPIERASHLLDQFARPRTLDADKVARAVWLLVYGYTLKIVVADSLAPIVDSLFVARQPFGWGVVLGTLAFGLQIYADFCGYSLIAKGAALLFGFDLIWNFRFPYWATSIGDFWHRWHVSLSSWLRDYLYIPLGGNRHGAITTSRNLLLTMGLGGLWHGASWNYVLWGLLHGVALTLWRFLPVSTDPVTPVGKATGWLVTMIVVFAGWFLFRAATWELMSAMTVALRNWEWVPAHSALVVTLATLAIPLAILEWLLRNQGDFFPLRISHWLTYPAYATLIVICLAISAHYKASFIYFQF